MLLRHALPCALVLAFANAGNNRPAKIAMMAITTSNSMRVKPDREIVRPRTKELDLKRRIKSRVDRTARILHGTAKKTMCVSWHRSASPARNSCPPLNHCGTKWIDFEQPTRFNRRFENETPQSVVVGPLRVCRL